MTAARASLYQVVVDFPEEGPTAIGPRWSDQEAAAQFAFTINKTVTEGKAPGWGAATVEPVAQTH